MTVTIVPHHPGRLGEVAAMLGRAFVDDPLYRWFWPDDHRRPGAVTAFSAAEVRLAARCGRVDLAVENDGRVVGAALWALPHRYPFPMLPGALSMARALPRIGLRGARCLPRLLAVERAHPPQPHWYLITLGVEPAMQGQRVGSGLVRNQADAADTEGIPIYLETFNPANPPFYRNLGFVDRRTVTASGRDPLPPFWTMLRPVGSRA